jgi:hypothetical protein
VKCKQLKNLTESLEPYLISTLLYFLEHPTNPETEA